MANLSVKLNGVEAHPMNLEGISIKLDFKGGTKNPQVNADNIEFDGDDATSINEWVATNGVMEGMPLEIQGCDETLLIGCLDATQMKAKCDSIEIPIKETGRIDWFNDIAPSVYFPYLASQQAIIDGVSTAALISKSDYIPIPYVVSEIPNYTQAAVFGLSSFMVVKELVFATKELTEIITEIGVAIAGDTPIAGMVVVSLVGLLVYEGILSVSLIKLVQSLIENVIQFDKYKYGMKVVTMFEKACAYLGMKFQSSVLQSYPYNQLVYIPTKINTLKRKERDDKKNPEAFGYYDGNFADFVRDFNDVFNVQQILFSSDGKTMIYEPHTNTLTAGNYQMESGLFVIPDFNNNNDPRAEPIITNASELASQYVVKYKLDKTELNTYNYYNGTEAQMQLIPKSVLNIRNRFNGKYVPKNLNFHLAKRKEELTDIEKTLKTIIDDINGLYSFVSDTLLDIIEPIRNLALLIPEIPEIPEINDISTGIVLVDGAVNGIIDGINAIISVLDFLIGIVNFIGSLPANIIEAIELFLNGESQNIFETLGLSGTLNINGKPNKLIQKNFDRIGYMLLSNDFMGQKLCIVNNPASGEDYKLLGDNSSSDSHQNYTSAGYLMQKFHSSNFGHYLRGNQFILFPDKEIPFCCSNFTNIKENNVFLLPDNTKAKMDLIDYTPIQDIAKVDFRVPQVYEKNHYEFITIDGDTNFIDGVFQPTKK